MPHSKRSSRKYLWKACRLSLSVLRVESFLSAKLTSTRGSPTASMSLDGSDHRIELHFTTRPFSGAENAPKYVCFQSLNGDHVDQFAALPNASAGSQDQERRQVPGRGADP